MRREQASPRAHICSHHVRSLSPKRDNRDGDKRNVESKQDFGDMTATIYMCVCVRVCVCVCYLFIYLDKITFKGHRVKLLSIKTNINKGQIQEGGDPEG